MEDTRLLVRVARGINTYSKELATATGGTGVAILGAAGAYSKIENIVQATTNAQANGEMTMQTVYAVMGMVGCGIVMKAYKSIREGMTEREEMIIKARKNMATYKTPPSNVVSLDEYRNKDIA